MGIVTDGTYLYFGDLNLMRKLDLATGMVSTVLGQLGVNNGSGNLDGNFKDAFVVTLIQSIAMDGTNLYMLTGTMNHTLRKVDLAAQTVSTLELFYADGTINPGIANIDNNHLLSNIHIANPKFKPFDVGYGLAFSRAMVMDGTYLYIAALASNQVFRIRVDGSDNGIPMPLTATTGPSHVDGPGNQSGFHYPTGICTDGKYLYVVNFLN